MYHEIKRKYEQDRAEMQEFTKNFYDGRKNHPELFEIEPMDTNVTQCYTCGIDTFYIWIRETKKHFDSFMCIRCATKIIEQIKENKHKYEFYYKYQDEDLEIFFKRLEGRIRDPSYQDTGLQNNLLLKGDWPQVITKQDLVEEGVPCIFYTVPPEDPFK